MFCRFLAAFIFVVTGNLAWGRWLPEERLTERPNSSDRTTLNNARAIASGPDGNLHVVWYGKSGSDYQVWYSCWDAQTREWSQDTVISDEPSGACYPAVAADDSGNVHVVWQVDSDSNALKYRRKGRHSDIWGQVETVATGLHLKQPSITARDPDFVVAAWEQESLPTYRSVFVSIRNPSGWQPPKQASEGGLYNDFSASVGVDSLDNIGVLWSSSRAGNCILFRTRTDTVWSRIDTLHAGYPRDAPCLCVESGGVCHAVWKGRFSGGSGDYLIYRQRRDSTWRDTVALPRVSRAPYPASLYADEFGRIHAVWCADTAVLGVEVFYSTAEDSGKSWAAPFRLTNASQRRENPTLCCGPGTNVQLVWTDYRHSILHPDVYCRRYAMVRDIGVERIERPQGVIDSGKVVTPTARICNYGDSTETEVQVWFRIDTVRSEQVIAEIPPGDTLSVEFDSLLANERGWRMMSCSTALTGDINPDNNAVFDSFFVCVRDVAVESIIEPVGVLPLDTVWPKARIRNRGNVVAECATRFWITCGASLVYADTLVDTLDPNSTLNLEFEFWLGEPGLYSVHCSTAYDGDMRPENDTSLAWFQLARPDIGITQIIWPPMVVDSGTAGNPVFRVQNFGEIGGGFYALFAIGTHYCDTVWVENLEPGQTMDVRFSDWDALLRGWHPVRCSVFGYDHLNIGDSADSSSVFVRVQDVSITDIVSPTEVVRESLVVPKVRLRNEGNVSASVVCRFTITGDSLEYCDSLEFNFEPESETLAVFRSWPTRSGQFIAQCLALCWPDMHRQNNGARWVFRVTRSDVGVSEIIWPRARVDSGAIGRPRARIKNFGSESEDFPVLFRIGDRYADTIDVAGLAPHEDREVVFADWQALMRGARVLCCSTMLDGDIEETNNASTGSVFVRVADAGVAEILKPVGTIGSGGVGPIVRVVNYGNEAESVGCWFEIRNDSGPVYCDSVFLELGPESDSLVSFRTWQASEGSYDAESWTVLPGDMVPDNDTTTVPFRVIRIDAAAKEIRKPVGVIQPGTVRPEALISNLGEEPANINVSFAISDSELVYADTVQLHGVVPLTETVAVFREWDALPGRYLTFVRVILAGDNNPENDTVSGEVMVESLVSECWTELASVPRGPRRAPVRDGGSLVAVKNGILALKGCNTSEWYSYDLAGDSWISLAPVPLGNSKHKVKTGAALCWNGENTVFALKGNRTRELWGYKVTEDTWVSLPGLPECIRPVKYGAGLAFMSGDTDRVFLIKGSGTLDFLVYWVGPKQWHARRSLPKSPHGRKARRGTCLTVSGQRLFCLKGGTNEFYEYFPDQDSWCAKDTLPRHNRIGWPRRCKRGAAIAGDDGHYVYAFKGGRCSDFWTYDVLADTWIQADDVPLGRHRRKVERGGALTWFDGRVYCLKGGGSREFWCYDPEAAVAAHPIRTGMPHDSTLCLSDRLHVWVGSGEVVVGPPVLLRHLLVFDALGQRVRCPVVLEHGKAHLVGIRTSGVYFLTTGAERSGIKITVVK